jgi:hypothetical protein
MRTRGAEIIATGKQAPTDYRAQCAARATIMFGDAAGPRLYQCVPSANPAGPSRFTWLSLNIGHAQEPQTAKADRSSSQRPGTRRTEWRPATLGADLLPLAERHVRHSLNASSVLELLLRRRIRGHVRSRLIACGVGAQGARRAVGF